MPKIVQVIYYKLDLDEFMNTKQAYISINHGWQIGFKRWKNAKNDKFE